MAHLAPAANPHVYGGALQSGLVTSTEETKVGEYRFARPARYKNTGFNINVRVQLRENRGTAVGLETGISQRAEEAANFNRACYFLLRGFLAV
jgi:hypothetical protein